jgi:hypothetical protein
MNDRPGRQALIKSLERHIKALPSDECELYLMSGGWVIHWLMSRYDRVAQRHEPREKFDDAAEMKDALLGSSSFERVSAVHSSLWYPTAGRY